MNEIPTVLFIFITVIAWMCLIISYCNLKYINVITGIVCTILFYFLSKISINGQLVEQFGDIDSSNTIITSTATVQNEPMSIIFLFLAILSALITIINIFKEVQYNVSPDLEGELFE